MRNNRWKDISCVIDDDWSDYELAKELYIWEGDEGDNKIKLNLGVSVKFGPQDSNTGTFGVEISADRTRDDIYRSFKLRDLFYFENTLEGDHGMRNGFRVRKAGDLKWTFEEEGVNTNN